MMLATQYAKALVSVLAAEPARTSELFVNLRGALKRRGHEKLLPQIATELEKLSLAQSRTAHARATTPERERTRILFELYKKLTQPSSHSATK